MRFKASLKTSTLLKHRVTGADNNDGHRFKTFIGKA
jgi:hypothetical protein